MSDNSGTNRIIEHLSPFLDPLDRVSDKSRTDEKGITDNPHLFTGEACLLIKKIYGELTFMEKLYIASNILDCTVTGGLIARHPKKFKEDYKITYNRVSHDEYNGICFMIHSDFKSFCHIADEICVYGKWFDWMYDDRVQGVTFFEHFKKNKKEALKQLWVYIKDYRANPNNTNEVDLRHPPEITSLFSWRQPRDRAFYYLTARQETTSLYLIWLCIATVLTAFRTINKKKRGGTILMVWFRNIVLQDILNVIDMPKWHKKILQYSINFFKWMMKKKYGDKYAVKLASAYFDRKDKNGNRHKMIDLVEKAVDMYPNL
jgi:hypothetical protein